MMQLAELAVPIGQTELTALTPLKPPPSMPSLPTASARTSAPGACRTAAAAEAAGPAGDRESRLNARRAFVELKGIFMRVLVDLHDSRADWLRAQVRIAEDPQELWALRAPILAALNGPDEDARRRRQMLRRGLDSVFDDDAVPAARRSTPGAADARSAVSS